MKKFTALLFLILWSPMVSFAWGPEGHQITADIARAHLTEVTRQHIRELIGTDDLASISTWADEIRPQRPETFRWHFVDIPWNADGFSEARDCFDPHDQHLPSDHHNCVVDRIEIFERVLADKNASKTERVEALKFLVHFVGDIHQPLHAIGEARGGNDIHVVEFGSAVCGARACNLHGAWDSGLIEHTGRDERSYDSYLETLIASENLQKKAGGGPELWANESFRIARQIWLNEGGQIDDGYYRKEIATVNERLALGGLRLASLLNEALGR
jgi:S1/P1 Nuclease